jgi:hypothetical protein
MIDFDTGAELYAYNADVAHAPGSMTKVMTLYCVYDAIRNGEISLDTIVPISKKVYKLSRDSSFINCVPLYYGQDYTVDEVIQLVIVHSASAAAVALAELVSGSEEAFTQRMTATAQRMGIDATYANASGVYDTNFVTPRAQVLLVRNFIRDFPDILTRSVNTTVNFRGTVWDTTNKLLTDFHYDGADGFKTGTTQHDGYCFCGTANRDGVRLIAVAMSSSNGNTTRYTDVITMLDYGFATRNQTVENLRQSVLMLPGELPYMDVRNSDWYYDDVAEALKLNLMQGAKSYSFGADTPLTYGDLSSLLRHARDNTTSGSALLANEDLSEPYNIVNTYSGSNLTSADSVTREQLAVVLWVYRNRPFFVTPAATASTTEVSGWAAGAVSWAESLGILHGYTNGSAEPQKYATRAEAAAMVLRLLNTYRAW